MSVSHLSLLQPGDELMQMNQLTSLRAPLSVNLEITEKCNLSCGWCFNAAPAYQAHMSEETAKRDDRGEKERRRSVGKQTSLLDLRKERLLRILDTLAASEVFEVRLFGGEFTVMKHWREILQYAYQKDFFLSFVSNGYLITQEDARLFASCGVRDCTISIHGPEEIHDSTTQSVGSFRKAVNATQYLRDEGINVSVAYTPDASNLAHVFDFVEDMQTRFGIDTFSISRLFSDSRYVGLSLSDYHCLLAEIERCHEELHVNISLADSFPRCKVPLRYWTFLSYCSQGVGFAQVDFNGSIKHCSATSHVLGNVLEKDMGTLWDEQLAQMRRLDHLPKSCKVCPIFCGGGCTVSRGVDNQFAPDEFIPWPQDEGWGEAFVKATYNRVRKSIHAIKQIRVRAKPAALPERPLLGQRYRIRQEHPDHYIAMFERAGVRVLTSLGAQVVELMDGTHSLDEMYAICREQFPNCRPSDIEEVVHGVL